MTKHYLLILGGFIVCHTIYFRFLFTRVPFDVQDVSTCRAIIYLLLATIFTIILLAIYYHLIRTYLLKKPIKETSRIFKMKKKIQKKMEKYGPHAALKVFFLFVQKTILPRLANIFSVYPQKYNKVFIKLMKLFRKNRLSTIFGKYYYHVTYFIFVGLPQILVATMFLIDVCYYEHIELFFKWSLILTIPLIFKTTLGILKIFYDENIGSLKELIRTEVINGKISYTYVKPEYEQMLSIYIFINEVYTDINAFNLVYEAFEYVRNKFMFITIYTVHCYLIGWIYILYFYGPNFLIYF